MIVDVDGAEIIEASDGPELDRGGMLQLRTADGVSEVDLAANSTGGPLHIAHAGNGLVMLQVNAADSGYRDLHEGHLWLGTGDGASTRPGVNINPPSAPCADRRQRTGCCRSGSPLAIFRYTLGQSRR